MVEADVAVGQASSRDRLRTTGRTESTLHKGVLKTLPIVKLRILVLEVFRRACLN
jgi:hypothetical protein